MRALIQSSKALICNECVELCVGPAQLSLIEIWQAASDAQRAALSEKIIGLQRHKPSDTAEIAKLARESIALLTHAKQNADDIKKRLTRIISIINPDDKARNAKAAKSNAKLDDELLPQALLLN